MEPAAPGMGDPTAPPSEPIGTTRGTSARVVKRNRRNARASTGPKSPAGKAAARGNALRHGLTANPAAGVVEQPRHFEELLRQVGDALRPRDAIEAGLCHRVAVALWRLQRAALADGAISGMAVRIAPLDREEIQSWLQDIRDFWRVEVRKVTDPSRLRALRRDKLLAPGERKWEEVRSGLPQLDEFRSNDLMQSPSGISAMLALLGELVAQLSDNPRMFGQVPCEQLFWLLGDGAFMFPTDTRCFLCPDEYPRPTSTQRLIGIARKRKPGTPIPPALRNLIDAQATALLAQRRVLDDSGDRVANRRHRRAALLPDESTLNRLTRYETHSERSLIRSLETLAKLRGATVETLSASLRGVTPDGTAVEFHGERTRWQPGEPAAGER